jgi:hypothetical protein
MLVNVKGCTVTVETMTVRLMPATVWVVVVDTNATSLTVEVTTSQDEQVAGQISSCELDVSLAAMAALAVTTALFELEVVVAELAVAPAPASADIELGVVVGTLLLCTAPSVCTTVDVEVEVTVT